MLIVLDVGCKNTAFVKSFKAVNPFKMFCLCGEPDFKESWNGQVGLADGFLGRKKIQSAYADFKVPNSSLDIVTLNSFHPLMPPTGIEAEIARCLKVGGLFISAHPASCHPEIISNNFKLVLEQEFPHDRKVVFETNHFGEIVYPASPGIKDRFDTLISKYSSRKNYIYKDGYLKPSIRVYEKIN